MSIFYYDEEKELELIRKDEYELGKLNGISQSIVEILTELGEVPEDIRNIIAVEQREDYLKRWLKLAAKMDSIEAF